MEDKPCKPDDPAPARRATTTSTPRARRPPRPKQPDRPSDDRLALAEGIDVDAASDGRPSSLRDEGRAREYDPSPGCRSRPTDPDTGANARADEEPIAAMGNSAGRPRSRRRHALSSSRSSSPPPTPAGARRVGYQSSTSPSTPPWGCALIALKVLTEPLGYWKRWSRASSPRLRLPRRHGPHPRLQLAGAVLWLSGAAIYGAIVWLTTRTSIKEAFVLSFTHLILWALIQLLFWIAPMVNLPAADPDAAPAPGRVQPATEIDRVSPAVP